ncbi:ras-related protein Rap-1b-like [Planoprotostelium fungivorum]|uniref:small monomeric GTPase n=1 Tax=Planoprotostelium fungivorum TaxID=1890364 RepID=A0A2P6N4A6_9EUKA|nr:ras-related protein Rap-1b-like [Planoprotostelium fungivorum]
MNQYWRCGRLTVELSMQYLRRRLMCCLPFTHLREDKCEGTNGSPMEAERDKGLLFIHKKAERLSLRENRRKTSPERDHEVAYAHRQQPNNTHRQDTANTRRLIVLGSAGVGKSAVTIRWVQGNFISAYDPTIEDCYSKTIEVDKNAVRIEILDTAGSETFSAMRELYMNSGQGFILVYSITQPGSLESLRDLRNQILDIKQTTPPMILIGNKSDLADERKISVADGQALAKEFGCPFYETSALEFRNIEEAFSDVMKYVMRQFPVAVKKKSGFCTLI